MTWASRLAWLALAAVHVLPALGLVSPIMRQRLYGTLPDGTAALLLAHRGLLFAALMIASVFAAFHIPARLPAAIALSVSIIGFLVLFTLGNSFDGPIRNVALVDCLALPLLAVIWLDIIRS